MKKLLAYVVITGLTMGAIAQQTEPFQASLTPENAIYPSTTPIIGLTLSIWGENPQHGLAFGFVNGTSGKSGGLSLGLVNYGEDYRGVQWSIANYMKSDFTGWQAGVINFTGGRCTGFQSGFVNFADTLSGLQLGFVNVATKTDGALQIGVVNVIQENLVWFSDAPHSLAPAMVIVNWRL